MSPLRHAVGDYLELRRGLGFKLVRTETRLRMFLSFLEERQAAERVRQGAELKSALLASLGHDLKTPLTRLRNRAEEALGVTSSAATMHSALEGEISIETTVCAPASSACRVKSPSLAPQSSTTSPA